jgi:phage terminase large subunit-like protein
MKVTAEDLRHLSKEEFADLMEQLGPKDAEELLYNWKFWARPDQLEPPGRYKIWMPLAGRGWGKTRTGAETVREWVKQGLKRIACVAPTKGDVRRVMVEGNSGLLSICSKDDKTHRGADMGYPVWSPTNNTATWANGAKAEFFSAEDPERLRGPQFHAAWCDELAAWRNMQATWDMLQFTLRLGQNPKVLITTTPKPVKLVRHIMALSKEQPDKYVVTTGSSYDNKDNIDLEALSQYEGTRLGRQELYAEVLEEAAGALWTVEMIDKCQAYPEDVDIEALQRIVVAVDPAVTANEESDMTGIVVAGIDVNGHGVVIEDTTEQLSPSGWAKKVVDLYHKYGADRIVAERNQGGEMVRHTIETEDNTVPIRLVHASRGKFARAEPVSALYEQGRVKHLPGLDELEQQMVTWEPLGSMGSPDRLDALVWAMTDLMLGGILKPNLTLSYETQSSASIKSEPMTLNF